MMPIVAAAILAASITYPETKTVDVKDTYHGTVVADPYRWLEQPASTPEVRSWIEDQNKVTFGFLDEIEGRDRMLNEIKRRINFERFQIPTRAGGRVFYERNDGLQNQDVFYVVDKPGAAPRVLLDPNQLSKDATVGVSANDYSEDGNKFLYALSSGGSDWIEWRVRDVATGKDLPDVVKFSKFGNGFFNAKGDGFYYLRYPEPNENEKFIQANTTGSIYFHKLGTTQADDKLIMDLGDKKDWFLSAGSSADRVLLSFYVDKPGSINNDLWVQDLKKPGSPVIKLFNADDAQYSLIGRDGDNLFIRTTKDAPNGKVISAALYARRAPITIIPEAKESLRSISHVGGKLIASYLKDAYAQVKVYSTSGKLEKTLKLPGIGTVSGFGGKPEDKTVFYSYSDFGTPATIFELDIAKGKSTVYRKPKLAFDTASYEAKQVFITSKDGTKVPVFIIHKKGLKLNGQNPTILYGYGGFGSPQVPWFSASRTVWMDSGGVFAVACIRGGSEYGKAWHEAAIKTNRQKAYDDFISAGEWLVKSGYADKKHLAIMGGSNGGLLVGVCMIQRPDLFAVAIPQVGVMDMLRFNQFTIGKAWESDYGSPQNETEFKSLLRISPYHTLKKGVQYPATLVTTADTDDRVVPAHSFKFAAQLQACHAGASPVLLRVETSSGHGASNLTKSLMEIRDIYAFILKNTGKKIPAKY